MDWKCVLSTRGLSDEVVNPLFLGVDGSICKSLNKGSSDLKFWDR